MSSRITRREVLTLGAAGAAALWLPRGVRGESRLVQSATQPQDFTFVHLTDMHVTPKRKGDHGYRACIESVLALRPRPAFALMGGDLAFDGLYTEKVAFEEQIRLYREITRGLGFPAHPCMGNHDALGWSARRKCAADDPDIGKKMIMDRLEWEKSYYSFDHGGWHFAVLDSIHPIRTPDGPSYEPRIGPEQLEWLAHDLGQAGDRPKVCVTHIAAFCAMGQYNGDKDRKALDGSMVLWDNKELRLVLERHQVKALLQGHSHRREEYRYNGVWYLTSPAVSGAWWSGNWHGDEPGYTELHCHTGGRLSWEFCSFAWQPQLEPEDELERKKTSERREFLAGQAESRNRERLRATDAKP
ncbi:MAG: metallophosphoesterase family protein [Phycisphaerae bacterium]